jgi:uncharacterized membrane protein
MDELNDPMGNSNNYKWGIFYYNRTDPRIFVPKRFGFGYTLNFGKPCVTPGFILILLIIFYQVFFH